MSILPPLAEMSLFGITIEPAVPMLLFAVVTADLVRRMLTRIGIDRFVWNWPLFMLSLYVCIAGGLILGMPSL